MDPIILTHGEDTVRFTNKDITVNDTAYPYSGISQLWHIPERSAYAFKCGEEMVALPYGENDKQLLQALLSRIAQALHLTIEEYRPQPRVQAQTMPEAGEAAAGQMAGDIRDEETDAVQPEESGGARKEGGRSGGRFSDRRFLIEMVVGILLIIAGIIGLLMR